MVSKQRLESKIRLPIIGMKIIKICTVFMTFKIRSLYKQVKRASADKQNISFLRIQQIRGTEYLLY